MKRLSILLALVGTPALAASKNPFDPKFWSLANTDFVVAIAFFLFVGLLAYLGVHKMLLKSLDTRAETIRTELDEAKALREEAQALLASYERKQSEVEAQAERIVASAKEEAAAAADAAKEEIATSVARRLESASEQIGSAEASAIKEVRDRAVVVAVQAAGDVVAKQMTAKSGNDLIDEAIAAVDAKLH